MTFELLEALVRVKLTGISAVESRLNKLKERMERLGNLRINAGGAIGGGSAGGRGIGRLTRRFAILRETAREARSDLVNTVNRTKTQLRALGDAPGVKELTAELNRLRSAANIAKGEFAVIGNTEAGAKRSTQAFREVNEQIRNLERRLRGLNQREGADEGIKRRITLARRLAQVYQTDVSRSIRVATSEFRRLERLGVSSQRTRTEIQNLTVRLNRLKRAAKDAITNGDINEARRLGRQYAGLRKEANKLATSLARIGTAAPAAGGFLSAIASFSGGPGVGALSILNRIGGAVSRIGFRALAAGARIALSPTIAILRSVQRIVQYGPQLAVLFGGLVLRGLVTFQQRLDQIDSLMNFAFGRRTQSQIAFVANLADRLGLRALDLRSAFGSLTAAMRGTGVELQTQQKLFRGLSQAAVVLGRSQDEVRSIFLAIEQIGSKGRLSAEELRRQLGNVLPGAFGIAARALGISNEELDKALKAGEISAGRFFNRFAEQLEIEFAQKAGDAAGVLRARLNRLQNQIDELRESAARFLASRVVSFIERLSGAAKSLGAFRLADALLKRTAGTIDFLSNSALRAFPNLVSELRSLLPTLQSIAASFIRINAAAIPTLVAIGRSLLPAIESALRNIAILIDRAFGFDRSQGFIASLATSITLMENLGTASQIVAQRLRIIVLQARGVADALSLNFSRLEDTSQRIINAYIRIALLQRDLNNSAARNRQEITRLIREAKEVAGIEFSGDGAINDGEQLRQDAVEAGRAIRSQIFSDATAFFRSLQISGDQQQVAKDNTTAIRQNTDAVNRLNRRIGAEANTTPAANFNPIPIGG